MFEQHCTIAVEFRTRIENQRSRRAIEKLGAKLDGSLRHHQILRDGSLRDTAAYSIISSDWPSISKGLLKRLKEQ
ncbi:MAG: GNAT family protein [Rhodocyclaceae bacterium]|nr:GNAT family protein [Rhodocyclaceae bacterium]